MFVFVSLQIINLGLFLPLLVNVAAMQDFEWYDDALPVVALERQEEGKHAALTECKAWLLAGWTPVLLSHFSDS